MQAVLLAAGKSSRFLPFNDSGHKVLVKIMGKTIIEHTLLSIKKTGIKEVIIIIGKDSNLANVLGEGKTPGIKITYIVQPEPLGMGDALLKAKDHLKSDFFLLNSYHVEFPEFKKMMEDKSNGNAVLLVKKDNCLERFGTLKTESDKVLDIIEKPQKGKELSNLRVIGIYLLNKSFLKILEETPLEHYNLEKALSRFAKTGKLKFVLTDKETVSLKYSWDIISFKNYLFKNMKKYVSKKAIISKDAQILGNVYMEDGVQVLEKACIKGPCYIGRNSYIGNSAILRQETCVEDSVVIGAFSEIKNSVVMHGSKIHSGFVGDSIIGEDCRIGAQFCSANKRMDRDSVKTQIKAEKVDTGLKFLGVIMGNNVHIGIKSSTMPGVIIGSNAKIGPSTTVLNNVSENSKYYTKFQEIVEEK